jgi:cytochrome c6
MKTTILILTPLLVLLTHLNVQAADAKENWEKHCAKCHGTDGKGDTKMGKKLEVKDYTDAKVQAEMKDDEMAKVIKEGRKEGDKTKMKPFSEFLNDEEIKAMVAYVRTLKK